MTVIPETEALDLPPDAAQEAALNQWSEAALALPDQEVQRLSTDTDLAYFNVRENHKVLAPHEEVIGTLPKVEASLVLGLPTLALALVAANAAVHRYVPPPAHLQKHLARGHQLRAAFMHQLKAAAVLGHIPDAELERILKGMGLLNYIQDLYDLAQLHRKHHRTLSGKSLITTELLTEAEDLSVYLRDNVAPGEALKPTTNEELAELANLRDRLWSLLKKGQKQAERVANLLELELRALGARRPPPRRKEEAGESVG